MIQKTIYFIKSFIKIGVVAAIPVAIGVVSINAMGNTTASSMVQKNQLPIPESTLNDQPAYTKVEHKNPEQAWQKHLIKIKPNGSLSHALDEAKINQNTTFGILQLKNSHYLTRLKAGDELQIWTHEGQLKKILYCQSEEVDYVLTEQDNGFQIDVIQHPIETKVVTVAGNINDSFYLSGAAAGLSAKTIMNLADIFTWEIDFIRQLRYGDSFKVIYEKRYINQKYIGDGDILAAQMTTSGEKHTAFLLKDDNQQTLGYFDHNQKNLKKAFLKNPVDYVRITSTFKPKRYHPVLQKWRAHRGVDYAGPVGTPIRATGDGKITTRGWSNSYGNLVIIEHANKYMTVYGHMSRFGKYKKDTWVKQGDVIGYIGMTGLATGPHLHYEFRVNGVHKDPLQVKFPDSGPVPKQHMTAFKEYAKFMTAQMERLNTDTQLVGNFE